MSNERIRYIDNAKAWLILSVVVGHICIVLNPHYDRLLFTAAQEFMSSFNMSAFFIINGILMGNGQKKWNELILKRCRTMLIPYCFFESLGILCRWWLYDQSLLTGIYNMITVRCNVGADWFLMALFMGNLLANLCRKWDNPWIQWATVLASLAVVTLLPSGQWGVVLNRGLMAYGFIMIGALLKKWLTNVETYNWKIWLGVFLITALCSMVNLKFGGNNYYGGNIGNVVTLILAGVCGAYMILVLSYHTKGNVWSKIGQESLTIMGTHQLVIYIFTALVPGGYANHLWYGMALFAVIVLVELLAVSVLNQYAPMCIGKKKKVV